MIQLNRSPAGGYKYGTGAKECQGKPCLNFRVNIGIGVIVNHSQDETEPCGTYIQGNMSEEYSATGCRERQTFFGHYATLG